MSAQSRLRESLVADRRLLDHAAARLRRTQVRDSDDVARRRDVVCCAAALLDVIAQHLGEVPREIRDQAVQASQKLLRE